MIDNKNNISPEYINLTRENLASEHLCCIIRERKPHPGVEAKRSWLYERLGEGHMFRKLAVKGRVFIEYAPVEVAWVPVVGDEYMYIYCLWVDGEFKGHGYASALMEYCIADAKAKGKAGLCMLGSKKQKTWLSDMRFAEKFGFRTVDETQSGYRLLALSFEGAEANKPSVRFAGEAKKETIEGKELTVYYNIQCPFVPGNVENLKSYCTENGIPASFIPVDSLQKAKALPCVFNNFAVFYKGVFETVNLLDIAYLQRILKK